MKMFIERDYPATDFAEETPEHILKSQFAFIRRLAGTSKNSSIDNARNGIYFRGYKTEFFKE